MLQKKKIFLTIEIESRIEGAFNIFQEEFCPIKSPHDPVTADDREEILRKSCQRHL